MGGELFSISKQLVIFIDIASTHFTSIRELFKFYNYSFKIILKFPLNVIFKKYQNIHLWYFKLFFNQSPIEWINVPRPPFLVYRF